MRGFRRRAALLMAVLAVLPLATTQLNSRSAQAIPPDRDGLASWAANFARPPAADLPTPEWVVSRELTPQEAGISLDAFRSAGYSTVVLVTGRVGPYFDQSSP